MKEANNYLDSHDYGITLIGKSLSKTKSRKSLNQENHGADKVLIKSKTK